jgi:hypothetical protein
VKGNFPPEPFFFRGEPHKGGAGGAVLASEPILPILTGKGDMIAAIEKLEID